MGKIPSVQLQKLVDRIPSRIFEVIKANDGSTKYLIKNLPSYSIVLLIGLVSLSKQNFKTKHKYEYTYKNELKFLRTLNLSVFIPYLSYV